MYHKTKNQLIDRQCGRFVGLSQLEKKGSAYENLKKHHRSAESMELLINICSRMLVKLLAADIVTRLSWLMRKKISSGFKIKDHGFLSSLKAATNSSLLEKT